MLPCVIRRRCWPIYGDEIRRRWTAYSDDHPYPYLVENGSPDARYAIVEKYVDHWQAMFIAVLYDNRAVAALARSNGRLDWEPALTTGYLS
jgi:hypothetical protein